MINGLFKKVIFYNEKKLIILITNEDTNENIKILITKNADTVLNFLISSQHEIRLEIYGSFHEEYFVPSKIKYQIGKSELMIENIKFKNER